LLPFVRELKNGGFKIETSKDRETIIEFCEKHGEAIGSISAGINCCLNILRVLDEYPLENLHTNLEKQDYVIPGWNKISKILKKSQ
jgi:hypothetical protein